MARRKIKVVNVEQLEVRQLMTGDITAVLQNNILYLNEAPGHVGEPGQVIVSQLPDGKIRVAGYVNNASPSPVNGTTHADFAPVNGVPITLVANLGGGNDRFVVANGTRLNDVTLNLGGNGSDVDSIDIQGLTTKGFLTISTGADVDQVNMSNSHVGDGVGTDDLTINTGTGRDTVTVGSQTTWSDVRGSLKIRTFDSADTETDTVNVNLFEAYKNVEVNTGNGEDIVNMLATTAGQDIIINSGNEKDTVTLREVQALDEFFIDLGAGDDTLNLNFVRANWFLARGGIGVDRLTVQNPSTTVIRFEDFNYYNNRKVIPGIPGKIDPPIGRI